MINLQGEISGSVCLRERFEFQLETEKISYIVLNTEKGYPSVKFYEANGFKADESLIFMAADV